MDKCYAIGMAPTGRYGNRNVAARKAVEAVASTLSPNYSALESLKNITEKQIAQLSPIERGSLDDLVPGTVGNVNGLPQLVGVPYSNAHSIMYVPLAEDRERSAAQKLPRKKLKPQAVPQPSLFHNGSLDGSGPLKAIIQHVHPTLPSPQLNSQHFNHPGINFQDERLSQETPLNVSHKFLNNQYQQHFGYFMNQNPCPTGSSELQIPKTQSLNQVDLQNVNGHIQNSFQYDHRDLIQRVLQERLEKEGHMLVANEETVQIEHEELAEQLVQNPAYSDQQIQFNNRINQNFNAPLPAPLVSTAPTPILAPPLAPMQSPQLAQFLPKPYLPPPYPNLKIDAQEDPDVQIVDIKPSTHELQGLRDLKKKEIILEPRSAIVFCAPFDLNPVGRFRIRNLFWARVAYMIEVDGNPEHLKIGDTIGTINAKSNKIIEISCEGFQYKPDAKDRIRISLTNAPEEDGNLTKEYFDGDVTIMKKSMFVEYRD
ncbi:hypothetical protein L5515_005422 [Caenorhabditis briggsae]|uniref:MSP domain-containing protein n=1 Tax=Caenorhabditis briggsae TaxID=6238 RepID=A0AAE9EPQ4_CAEBR|nr:hypothetical protein L5515_005422 [Caenorhabditis briggsae]